MFTVKYVTKTESTIRFHRKQHLLLSETIMGSSIKDRFNLRIKKYSKFPTGKEENKGIQTER